MAIIQKKEFIASLKRLKIFFDSLTEYRPDEATLKVKDYLETDLTQPDFRIVPLPQCAIEEELKIMGGMDFRQSMKLSQSIDRQVLTIIMDPLNQSDDEDFILKAMQVSEQELKESYKCDQDWFEEATHTIRQARKFQYLIQQQDNLTCKEQIRKKTDIINLQLEDINDQEKQLNNLETSIKERKDIENTIRQQIRAEEIDAKAILKSKERQIQELKRETEKNKMEFSRKIKDLESDMDVVRHIKHELKHELQSVQQNNNMMFFFPTKVEEQKCRIERKKVELDLSRKIITETLGFMKQRVLESKQKQKMVREVNDFVGNEVQQVLAEEETFYQQVDKDKLLTPPYVYVKRIQRPGYHVEPEKTEIGKGKKSNSKSKRRQSSKNAIQRGEININNNGSSINNITGDMELQDVLNIQIKQAHRD